MRHIEKLNAQRSKFMRNDATAWQRKHAIAMLHTTNPIAMLVRALATYADNYRKQFESSIGDDGVLGPAWVASVNATLELLNGELGDLDGGTVDSFLREMLKAEGCDAE